MRLAPPTLSSWAGASLNLCSDRARLATTQPGELGHGQRGVALLLLQGGDLHASIVLAVHVQPARRADRRVAAVGDHRS